MGGGVIGNKIIVYDQRLSTIPAGSAVNAVNTFTIFDATTGTSLIYSGLNGYNKNPESCCVYDGRLWVGANSSGLVGTSNLSSIQTNGVVTTHGPIDTASVMAGASDRIFWSSRSGDALTWRDTSATSGSTTVSGATAVFGLYALDDSTLIAWRNPSTSTREVVIVDASAATPAITATYPTTTTLGTGTAHRIGDRVVWSSLAYFDVVAGTHGVISPTPTGFTGFAGTTALGDDGYIYGVSGADSTKLTVINPATGQWETGAIPGTGGRRGPAFAAAGKIYVPSGEPLSR